MRTYLLDYFNDGLRFHNDGQVETSPAALANFNESVVLQERVPRARLTDQHIAQVGQRLYDLLSSSYDWLHIGQQGPGGWALHVDTRPQHLRRLPLEMLNRDGSYLCLNRSQLFTPVHRVSNTRHESRAPQNRPLRVLFLACSPQNVQPVLQYEAEETLILGEARRHGIELVVEESGSLAGLKQQIESYDRGYFDVLHLTGHADIKNGEPIFLMEDEFGDARPASVEDIVEALEGDWPRLVFLSGCKTGEASHDGTLPSMCERIVQLGAPAVLGWALPVRDDAASIAAATFYKQLAKGISLDEAVARARHAIDDAEIDHWYLLHIYAAATELSSLVTPPGPARWKKLLRPDADREFFDAGQREMEVCPRSKFVGRRRSVQRCLRALKSPPGEDGSFEGVALTGMGGLGKSSLAARLCERLPHHDHCVWIGQIDETQLLHVLSDKLADPKAIEILNETGLTLKQRIRGMLQHRWTKNSPAENPSILFVFDDFERNCEGYPSNVLLDQDGHARIVTAALAVLRAVTEAIHEAGTDSRVIVTCRYELPPISTNASLYHERLEHFADSALAKKLAQLEAFGPRSTVDATARQQAVELADGNPRLLEWLDKVLRDPQTNDTYILDALQTTASEFREHTLLEVLLAQQTPECRRLLALANLYHLPVGRDAIAAVAAQLPVEPQLDRAAKLGLIEVSADASPQYYVTAILAPLVQTELSAAEQQAALERAADHAFQAWWENVDKPDLSRAMEIHRLALLSGRQEIAVTIGNSIATAWINRSRYREARSLCSLTLTGGEDYRIIHSLARAEQALGEAAAALSHYRRALTLCPALTDQSPPSVSREKAAIIHNLASLTAMHGEIAQALSLYQQSLDIDEQIGYVQGKAATLHQMAGLHAQQGDVARAMELFQQSLDIQEQTGDVRGKAATLQNLAYLMYKQEERGRALELYAESVRAFSEVRAWVDLVRALGNLSALDEVHASQILAQAIWLTLRCQVPLEYVVDTAAAMVNKLGPDHLIASLVAAFALAQAMNCNEKHPDKEKLQNTALHAIAACADARGIAPDQLVSWLENEHLNDPEFVVKELDRAMVDLVPAVEWLFDRSLLSKPNV